jgi:rod shape-determining protein MreC
MWRSLRSRSGLTLLLVVTALAAIILQQSGRLTLLQDLFFSVTMPVQRTLLDWGNGVNNLFGGFEDVNALRSQVDALTNEVNRLTIDQVRLRELESENTNLRDQLSYKQANPDYQLFGATVLERNPDLARVLSSDPSNLANYILIDQGQTEGVAVGMPVITPAGLVGRVTETGAHWSKVLLIVDPSSSVNIVIQSSRATGVLQGQVNGTLLIKYLPQGDIVKKDDLVLTSGIGGGFPKRLVIGQVLEVEQRDIDLFQAAVVKPSVDFNRLEFVLIIKKFTPQDITQEPTPTPTRKPTATPAAQVSPTPTPKR